MYHMEKKMVDFGHVHEESLSMVNRSHDDYNNSLKKKSRITGPPIAPPTSTSRPHLWEPAHIDLKLVSLSQRKD